MGKKGGGDGGADAIQASQDRAIAELRQGKTEGYGFLDKAQAEALQPYQGLMPQAQQIAERSFGKMADFDNLATAENQRVQQAYLKPAQRQITERLSNLFSGSGTGARTNSRQQNMLARISNEMMGSEAQRQYELENQVKQQMMGDIQNQYNFANQPLAYSSGVNLDIGKSKANTAVGSASQVANVFQDSGRAMATAQQNAQASKQAGKGGMGQLLGAGMGAASSMFGGKK